MYAGRHCSRLLWGEEVTNFFFAFHGVVIQWAKEREQIWIAVLNLAAMIGQGGTSVPSRGKLMQQERLRFLHQSNVLGGPVRSKSGLGH